MQLEEYFVVGHGLQTLLCNRAFAGKAAAVDLELRLVEAEKAVVAFQAQILEMAARVIWE